MTTQRKRGRKTKGRTAEAEEAAAEAFTIHARYKGIHPPPEIEDGVSTRLSRVDHYLEDFRIQASYIQAFKLISDLCILEGAEELSLDLMKSQIGS